MISRIFKNKNGASLIAVLIIIFVAALLSTALYGYANTQMKQAVITDNMKQAEYLANTGIEATVKVFMERQAEFDEDFMKGTESKKSEVTTTYTYLLKNAKDTDGDGIGDYWYDTHNPHASVGGINSNDAPDDDEIQGHYVVTVTYPVPENGLNTINFKATATYGGETIVNGSTHVPTTTGGTVVTKEAYLIHNDETQIDAYAEGWYDNRGYALYNYDGGADHVSYSPSSVAGSFTELASDKTYNNEMLYLYGRRVSGAITFPPVSNNTFKVGAIEVDRSGAMTTETDIGFEGKSMHFQLPVDLSANHSAGEAYMLSLSARDIVFDAPVTLYVRRGLFTSSIGTAVFSAPHGTGMRYADPSTGSSEEKFLKVYFKGGVNLSIQRTFFSDYSETIIPPGSVFYVRLDPNMSEPLKDESGNLVYINSVLQYNSIAIDLLDWWRDDKANNTNSILPYAPDWALDLVDSLYDTADDQYDDDPSINSKNRDLSGTLRLIDPDNVTGDEESDLIPPLNSSSQSDQRLIWK